LGRAKNEFEDGRIDERKYLTDNWELTINTKQEIEIRSRFKPLVWTDQNLHQPSDRCADSCGESRCKYGIDKRKDT